MDLISYPDGKVLTVEEAREYLADGKKKFNHLVRLNMLGMENSNTAKNVELLIKRLDEESEELGWVKGGDKVFVDLGMKIWIFEIKGSRTFSGTIGNIISEYYSRVHVRAVPYWKALEDAGEKGE